MALGALAKCAIWGTPAEELAKGGDGFKFDSPRTGGTYRITGTAYSIIGRSTPEARARLTTWIVDQRRSGNPAPLVTDETIEATKITHPLRISERQRRFFLLALARDTQPSSRFKTSGLNDDQFYRDTGEIAAWTECRDHVDIANLLRLLAEQGLISANGDLTWLTAKGFEKMEALESGAAPTTQAFVAMWFDPSMEDAFCNGFSPAIESCGCRPFRIDRKEHGNKIDDEIIAEIRRSRFVIADFTCGTVMDQGGRETGIARGGVYYEAGFAQGLRIPVIWSCRTDCIQYLHFDTRQFNHIVWTNPADLREKLSNRIRAMII